MFPLAYWVHTIQSCPLVLSLASLASCSRTDSVSKEIGKVASHISIVVPSLTGAAVQLHVDRHHFFANS